VAVSSKRRAFLAGAAATWAATCPAIVRAQSSSLRILTVASDPGALPFYAQENGFFEKAGLSVTVSTMGNGAAIMGALAGDAVDIGNANAGTVAAAVIGGLPLTIIADGGLYSASKPTTLMCVKPDSTARGPKDLAGAQIAVNGLRIVADAGIEEWMRRGGADPKSVSFIEMPFSTMQPLLDTGRLAAAFIGEPILSTIRSKVRIIGAPNDTIGREFSYAAYMAKSEWVVKNRDLASRFVAVIQSTAVWANQNVDAAGHILAKYAKLPESIVSSMVRVRYATSLTIAHLQPSIDIMAKYGYIAHRIDANTIVTRV
jgi:NitT/TauT family transport system substrate-binding protein